jgi:hypothetical protein
MYGFFLFYFYSCGKRILLLFIHLLTQIRNVYILNQTYYKYMKTIHKWDFSSHVFTLFYLILQHNSIVLIELVLLCKYIIQIIKEYPLVFSQSSREII